MTKLRDRPVQQQLFFWFTVIALIPLFIGASFSYYFSTRAIEQTIENKLQIIAQEKARYINAHIRERIKQAYSLSINPELIQEFLHYYNHGEEHHYVHPLSDAIIQHLQQYRDITDLYDIFIITPGKEIIRNTRKDNKLWDRIHTLPYKQFIHSLSLKHAGKTQEEQGYYLYINPDEKINLITLPMTSQGNIIAYVAIQLMPDELINLSNDYSGLGDSGEILIVSWHNQKLEFITPPRHAQEAQKNKDYLDTRQAQTLINAAKGHSGMGRFIDYRNKEVIASWSHLDSANWGIITKIDIDEAQQPIHELTQKTIIIVIALLIIMAIVTSLFSRHMIAPIHKLIAITRKMARGDFSVHIPIDNTDSKNEIIELSNSFNQMAEMRNKYDMDMKNNHIRLDTLINNASEGILTVDEEQKITLFNPEAERQFGYSAKEVLGKNMNILLPRYVHDKHLQYVHQFRDSKERKTNERTLLLAGQHRDGTTFPARVNLSKARINHQWYFTAFINDVTQQQDAEKKLIATKNEAERANQAKSEFLANMSHELRTPMHGILSFANLGLRRIDSLSTEKIEMYFQQISNSGDRLLNLLNDLLDLAKLEAGKMEMSSSSQSLQTVTEIAINEQRARLDEMDINIIWADDNSAGDGIFDKERIAQVITNLLSNAIKFTPSGSNIHIHIEQQFSGQYDMLHFSIYDEGDGIPEDEIETIFGKFNQSSRTTTGTGGTGLGLPICQQIIEAHSGKIWADNKPDGGALFQFTIPVNAMCSLKNNNS
ncbi:MAG: PAS domain S-box protein [Gammaproteobacteria bacterium]|nr:PAS domain S-box protein [Gammaproteobacteria bacterium]